MMPRCRVVVGFFLDRPLGPISSPPLAGASSMIVSVICLSSCCVDYGFMLVTLKLFVISRSHLSVVGF